MICWGPRDPRRSRVSSFVSLTFRTSSDGGVKAERVNGRYLEFDTIGLEFI